MVRRDEAAAGGDSSGEDEAAGDVAMLGLGDNVTVEDAAPAAAEDE
eukprot:COSAG06_NODE_51333_length_313_cov_0.471963_2_plen_45_part_01